MGRQSLGERMTAIAVAWPARPAVVAIDAAGHGVEVLSWADLESRTRHVAAQLAAAARTAPRAMIAWVPGSSTVPGVVTLLGGLRAGLTVAILDASAPPAERERQLVAVRNSHGDVRSVDDLLRREDAHDGASERADRPDDPSGQGSWILMTGGTTGLFRPIRGHRPPVWNPHRGAPLLLQRTGWLDGQVQLVAGPLHHAAPLTSFVEGVLSGNTMVITNGYYPELLFDLVEEYRVEWVQLTPVHMRMADRLLASRGHQWRRVRAVLHTAAPCPAETKLAWIDALGPGRVFEMYAATEAIGTTLCTGTEWLQRPGTVGRGFMTKVRILDERHRDLGAGQVGEIYLRSLLGLASSGRYRGLGGFESAGDHGRLDDDGYLYVSGRADDLVLVGAENVYLGEVEKALLAHDDLLDAAVVAVADDALMTTLHAYVVPRAGTTVDERALRGHCRGQLPPAKRPQAFHVVTDLPRNEAGKLLRFRLSAMSSR